MRLYRRARQALEVLIAVAKAMPDQKQKVPLEKWTKEEMTIGDAAGLMEYVLTKKGVTPKWVEMETGKVIKCDCDDPCCYRALEVGQNILILYEDIRDKSTPYIVFDLPDKVKLLKDTAR